MFNLSEYFGQTSKAKKKTDLSEFSALMEALGNPQDSYRIVHIAGTNGKGSTSSFVANMLRENGYNTALFTSPALLKANERMRINGLMIDDERLLEIAQEVAAVEKKLGIAYAGFDRMTACAMLWFAREQVDFAVIETGIGGRLDDTNIVNSEVAMITEIDYDHMQTLGDSLEAIAREKCAIIKEGQLCAVIHPQKAEVMDVIAGHCKALRVPMKLVSQCKRTVDHIEDYEQDCSIALPNGVTFFQHISMMGRFQLDNAAAALLLAQAMGLDMLKVNKAIEETVFPGRMELLEGIPPVLLDGAHNPHAAKALAEAVEEYFPNHYIILITAMMEDKDCIGIAKGFAKVVDYVFAVPLNERSLDPDMILRFFKSLNVAGKKAKTYQNAFVEALKLCDNLPGEEPLVLVAGSLYLAGGFRAFLLGPGSEDEI